MSGQLPKKRILFVDLGATFGGAEIYLENLIRPLASEADCFVLCSNHEFRRRLIRLPIKRFDLFCGTGVRKVVQLLCAAVLLPWLLLRQSIDTVQINGYAEIILLPVARLFGRKAIATRHLSFDIEADHWWEAPGRFMARALYRTLAFSATRIVCVSAEVGREVEQLIPAKRVSVIPNWVTQIPPFQRRPFSISGLVTVLFVARLVEHKGLQVLLDAARLLAEDRDARPVGVLVAGDGPFRAELARLALGLDVEFAGYQSDVSPFYERADIFVCSSLGPEGSSLVTLEAMSHSLPCVMSDLEVHREISRQGQTALLFPNGDAEALARCLQRLMTEAGVRERYAAAGYESIVQAHSPEVASRAYRKVFGIEGGANDNSERSPAPDAASQRNPVG